MDDLPIQDMNTIRIGLRSGDYFTCQINRPDLARLLHNWRAARGENTNGDAFDAIGVYHITPTTGDTTSSLVVVSDAIESILFNP